MSDTSVLDGLGYDHGVSRDTEADRLAATSRLAATTVRKLAMPHDWRCGTACPHRNHRRDRMHLDILLDILDLPDKTALPSDYGSKLAWDSVSRSDVQVMSGRVAA